MFCGCLPLSLGSYLPREALADPGDDPGILGILGATESRRKPNVFEYIIALFLGKIMIFGHICLSFTGLKNKNIYFLEKCTS